MLDLANNTIFGHLTIHSCYYFLLLSIFFFVILVVVFFTEVFFVYKNFKSLNLKIVFNGFLLLFNVFIAYFVNRLLFTMCHKTFT
jgi:hypothetical protein